MLNRARLIGPLAVLAAIAVVTASKPAAAADRDRPNIVFIMIDDLGWTDLGCYGNEWVETPHVDRLADDGVRFTDFYAAGAVCSPTRASIQSGQNQARFGLTDFIAGHWRPFEKVVTPQTALWLPEDLTTVGEALQSAGYRTAYFGKWHLSGRGKSQPWNSGYEHVILRGGRHFGFRPRGNVDIPEPEPEEYLADYLTDRTVEFIERQQNGDRPFFAFLSHYAVHIPLQAKQELIDKYKAKPTPDEEGVYNPVYAAMIEHCDRSLGRIREALDRTGQANNTMVVFTSDNGGLHDRYGPGGEAVTSNAPLRNEKGSVYEGGIRVPLIVHYPGVTPRGAVCEEPTISHDFFPTFVAAAGGELPENQPIDGVNLLPVLRDPAGSLNREAIYFHYPHYHHSRPASVVRAGGWKLIEFFDDGSVELYHLAEDIGERNDLAQSRPEKARALRNRLHAWRKSICAAMPMPNPAYNAKRAGEWWSRRRLKPIDMERLADRLDNIPVNPQAARDGK